MYKKGLCVSKKEEERVKQYLSIPEHEQVCLEIAVGHYKESFDVPVSARKAPEDIGVFKR